MVVWNLRRRSRLVTAAALAGGALVACHHDKGAAPLTGNGTMHVVHASPDAGAADILLDNGMAVTGAPYLTDTALAIAAGNHTLAFNAPSGSATSLVKTPIFVSATASYDLIAAGPAASVTVLGGENPPVTFDITSQAAFRFFNAMADTGAKFPGDTVDLYFTDSTGAFATARYSYTSVVPFTSPVFNGNGNPVYFPVEPNKYHIKVTAKGDTTRLASDMTVVVTAGQVRTVVAASSANRASGSIVVIPDAN